MPARLSLLAALVLLLGLALAAPTSARLEAAADATRLTDATGDSGAAPDIRHVDVGNDVVRGPIVIWVETPNRPKLAAGDLVQILLDADLDQATGLFGIDHVIAGGPSGGFLIRWDGTTFAQAPSPTLRWRQYDKWVRISIHPSDLGNTRAFNYVVVTSTGEEDDFAPEDGFGSYSLSSGPLVLSLDEFALNPKAPRAGARMTALLYVNRHDTAEPLTEGTVACTVKLGGKTVASRKGRVDDAAFCTLVLPKTAKGKVLGVRLSATHGGKTVAKTWTGRVR